jgi:hypothetical protein
MTEILVSFKSDPEVARRFGWTKRHSICEMFVIGKWRTVGFYTPTQIGLGKWREDALEKLRLNAPGIKDPEFKMA